MLTDLAAIALGLLAGLLFVGSWHLARRLGARDTEALIWCPGSRAVRRGVRLPDGSIDCPCGTHTTIHITTGD